jgi:hypothetical protein
MSRRSGWAAPTLGVGLAAVGGVVAYVLHGGLWAGVGAAIGAVAGAFAPTLYDGMRKQREARQSRRAAVEQPPAESRARLLDPRLEVVGFIGRQAELAALLAWCEDDQAGRLRLVTGSGGVGKTRLAVELAKRITMSGWKCERVAEGKESEIIGLLAVTRGRALLVVDYAETRIGLGQMLTALAGDQGKGLKVLLLARSAGDWWDQLGVAQPEVWDLVQVAKSAELVLSPVVAADLADADVITQAVASFARYLGVPERTVEIYGDSARRRVLDLHAAALVAVLADVKPGTVRVDLGKVLEELLRHESHFWYDSAKVAGLTYGADGMSPLILRQIVTAGCLLGAATEEEARALLGRVPGLSSSARVRVARWLRELYPPGVGESDWLVSFQPDRLAELLSVRELAESTELARACLTSLDARQALRAVTLLAHASSDNRPQAESLFSQTLPEVADFIIGLDAPRETLEAIYNAIPYPTVILAGAAAALAQQIIALLPVGSAEALRAYWLAHLGPRLSGLGRADDALTGGLEALAIFRKLAAASPDRYLPYVASSLSNLGTQFSALVRLDEALTAELEAVAIYREVAAASPDRYRPYMATSLSNLGLTLSKLGRLNDALPVTDEAIVIYRELPAASSGRYRPNLAGSLSNLGLQFSALGRLDEALTAELEAVVIYREVAAASPDRYRPDLADSLANLSIYLFVLGRPGDALPVAEEAVATYRELPAASSGRYRPDLARSLSNLGLQFSALGRLDEALTAKLEAVAIYRELAARNPDRYRPNLAASLSNLDKQFAALGRFDDALLVVEEGVATYRELAAASPDRYRPDLAASQNNLGAAFLALGRFDDALPVVKETVATYRELAAARPDRYRPDLASSLDVLAYVLAALHQHADAEAARDEAERLSWQLGR